jgi:ribosome maturation factor RimP
MQHTLHDQIATIIGPSLLAMGYALVQIRMIEGGRRTLQIMAERTDEKNMTVEDCATISHSVSALLDVEDPISGAYVLEVSSPGIDRPLVKQDDFKRFKGFDIKLETKLPVEGRKRFKGKLTEVSEDKVTIKTVEGAQAEIPFHMVQSAKLLLTDELINWHGKNAEATNEATN